METEKFKLKDIGYGFIIPLLVGLLIVAFPAILRPALDSWFPPPDMMTGAAGSDYAFITVIFTQGFSLIVMFAIPVILGLIWNKWAGGAAGFLNGHTILRCICGLQHYGQSHKFRVGLHL